MVQITQLLSILAFSGVALAAPANGGGATITVKNNCGYNLQVNQLTNGESSAGQASEVSAGSSKQYSVDSNWGGRFWGRKECSGGSSDCLAGQPASLAEFTLKGASGKDFYDVSLVDGFNLPIGITSGQSGCKAPSCSTLPTCPKEFVATDGKGNTVGCKSACAAENTDETCCRGSFNSPQTCKTNSYASAVKSACPEAYSFAYDDASSTFTCESQSYTVTFCPA